ncbi:MAG: HD domain-containing protein, partial [Candidatus Heimdallarchaeota archaeon]|nr:HD domain-containing protein [Candidatus Heimdallarchaeota archaeon]
LRMSNYSASIARKMGLNENVVERILYAAPMHDIGKIGTPDRILLKHGKLDPDEWEIMKEHATNGAQILSDSKQGFIRLGEVISLTHHEKWDGSGYPKGLKGTEISVPGHITAIADVFDALTTERPYKKAFSIEKSSGIIEESSGSHFNPEIVDIFFAIKDEILSIKETYKDEEESLIFKMTRGKV